MFRPQYIEILKSASKLFFHESTSEQRYRTFEKWVRREMSLRIFRILVEQKQTSGPDFASGRHIRAGHHIRTGPDIPSGHIWGMYGHIFILCVPYGPIWPYMGLYGTKFRQPQPWKALAADRRATFSSTPANPCARRAR